MTDRHVDFWFDFVSGYSWIAMIQAEDFAAQHDITWRPRPFVLGVVVERCERKTVAQVGTTRSYAIFDVARQAHRLGKRLAGPPEHPFLSLKALRAAALFQDSPLGIPVARALFEAGWERNLDLTDDDVVRAAVAEAGAPVADLMERIAARETKDLLRKNTDEALASGVFGAPFYRFAGEPFWGQDRLPLLAERLAGQPGLDAATQGRILRGEAETA